MVRFFFCGMFMYILIVTFCSFRRTELSRAAASTVQYSFTQAWLYLSQSALAQCKQNGSVLAPQNLTRSMHPALRATASVYRTTYYSDIQGERIVTLDTPHTSECFECALQNPSWWHANVCGVSNSECTILSSDPKDCAFGIRHFRTHLNVVTKDVHSNAKSFVTTCRCVRSV